MPSVVFYFSNESTGNNENNNNNNNKITKNQENSDYNHDKESTSVIGFWPQITAPVDRGSKAFLALLKAAYKKKKNSINPNSYNFNRIWQGQRDV